MYVLYNDPYYWVSKTVEPFWECEAVQVRLCWGEPKTIEEFRHRLDAGEVVSVGGGVIDVWRCKTPDEEDEMRRKAEETQAEFRKFYEAIWGAGGEAIL
jgi:hypothetical protein